MNAKEIYFGFAGDGKGDKMILCGPLESGDYGLGIFQLKEPVEINHVFGEDFKDYIAEEAGTVLVFHPKNGVKSLEQIVKLSEKLLDEMKKDMEAKT